MEAGGRGVGRLPTRSETPRDYQWRLEDLFASDAEWETEYDSLRKSLLQAEEYRGQLGTSAQKLLDALRWQDAVDERLGRVYAYARMRKDEDTTNTRYQELSSRAQTLAIQASSAFAFMNPEILGIAEDVLQRFLDSSVDLQLYRHTLEDLLRQKPHVLPEAEEQLLAQFSEIAQGPSSIFGMLNDADIVFPNITDEQGQEVQVTKGRYISLVESRDRRVRRDAFQALYSSYIKQRNTLAAILHASVKKDCLYARVRNYNSALEAALDDDNMPISVYDNLIQVIRRNLPLMHRYVALRKRLLGLDELHMYDLFTPLVAELEFKVPFGKAKSMVLEAVDRLGSEYRAIVEKGLASAWIDVYENVGKTSGAYSWGVYGVHPFVLLNWQDTLDNVFTLAHEMGHALHSYFSNQAQPYVYSGYSIFLAEIASTLNENLLTQRLLGELSQRQQRIYLISHHLDQFRTTVYRQTMFAEFEKIIHTKVEAGEPLTADNLSGIYRGLNRDYYGDDIVLDPEIDIEWARIPHFYRSFYVYKYATGFSAATALAKQIREEGEPAIERYLRFLASGSSDYPLALLQAAGVDMSTPEPLDQALGVFAALLDELDALT